MVQRGRRTRFLLEAVKALRIAGKTGREDFDGDVAPEARIARAIDLTHPTGTQRGNDFVGAEARPSRQGHESGLILVVALRPCNGEWGSPTQLILQPFRRNCQQMRTHPSDRNASWMSARLS